MTNILKASSAYLEEAFGLRAYPIPWIGQKYLPFILNKYSIFEINILNHTYLLVIDSQETPLSAIQKQMHLISKESNLPCIYVASTLSSYTRLKLMEDKQSFIIPNRQLYLPYLGFDFREYFTTIHPDGANLHSLSPATQVVLIGMLLGKLPPMVNATALLGKLPYSKMTLSRSVEELQQVGIGIIYREGVTKWLQLIDNRQTLWSLAEPLLRDPVKKTIRVTNLHHLQLSKTLLAGESALAEHSFLARPHAPTYAVGSKEWLDLRNYADPAPSGEWTLPQIQVWHYDPKIFSTNQQVDPISLYLSLRNLAAHDSRVAHARNNLLRRFL